MRSTLHLFLLQLAQGETQVLNKLLPRLAESIVIIPALVLEETPVDDSRVSVRPYRLSLRNRSHIPVFTQLSLFKEWFDSRKGIYQPVEILCADLCSAVDVHSWLLLDPGSEHEATLTPEDVDLVTDIAIDEDLILQRQPSALATRPQFEASEDTPFFIRKGSEENDMHTGDDKVRINSNSNRDKNSQEEKSRVRTEDSGHQSRVRKATVVFNRSELFNKITFEDSDRPHLTSPVFQNLSKDR